MTLQTTLAGRPKGEAWHSQSAEEVLAQLGFAATGLSATEAAQRREANGRNELKRRQAHQPDADLPWQFKNLIVWILIAVGVVSGVLGEMVDAIAIVAIGLFTFAAVELDKWLRFRTPQPVKSS